MIAATQLPRLGYTSGCMCLRRQLYKIVDRRNLVTYATGNYQAPVGHLPTTCQASARFIFYSCRTNSKEKQHKHMPPVIQHFQQRHLPDACRAIARHLPGYTANLITGTCQTPSTDLYLRGGEIPALHMVCPV